MPSASCCSVALGVEHAHVDDDLAVLVARMALEPDAHPAVALVAALEAARDTVSAKAKNAVVSPRAVAEAVEVQLVLVVEHRLQPRAADVALAAP